MFENEFEFKHVIIVIILIAVGIASIFLDYFWTKNSIEDLSGKEVKPSTVIWTMLKTADRK